VLNAARACDRGDAKIKEYRRTFKRLARDCLSTNEISQADRDDIYAMVFLGGPWHIWEPMLYVIPRAKIEQTGRLHTVAVRHRSGIGDEFQIFDLHRSEFDMIVLEP
jgi:hypothetical protein